MSSFILLHVGTLFSEYNLLKRLSSSGMYFFLARNQVAVTELICICGSRFCPSIDMCAFVLVAESVVKDGDTSNVILFSSGLLWLSFVLTHEF